MNCYVCWDDALKQGVIIDPAAYSDAEKERILDFLDDNEITIKYILNTHGHLDHILGNKWASEMFQVPILMHENDLLLVTNSVTQATMFGLNIEPPPSPDRFIKDGDQLTFSPLEGSEGGVIDNCQLKIVHTPGHSPGSVCYVNEADKSIFVGDLIFRRSIGRTDLWRGDMDELLRSIKERIFTYPDDYTLYPGHYDPTTIGEEKAANPFLT